MYGSVARFQLKPGVEQQLLELTEEFRAVDATAPGFKGEVVFRSASAPNEYFLAVLFESEEAYRANGDDPAQHQRYLRFRELLTEDPEWHDSEVVYANL